MFRFLLLLAYFYISSTGGTSMEAWLKPVPLRDIGARIINGEEAKIGQLPWQVAIMGSSAAIPRYLCGGALISDEWVLTAGHCVEGAISATIYSGTTSIDSPNSTRSTATEFILHEGFSIFNLTNDIGLIRLQTPVTLNRNIQPIALAEEELYPNTNVTLSGWGMVSDYDPDPYSPTLRYITVTTIENKECSSIYGTPIVYDGLVCTSTGRPIRSPCLGDSGAPVVINVDKDPVHVAVYSFVNGFGCEFAFPAGHSRTAYFRDWIRNQTGI